MKSSVTDRKCFNSRLALKLGSLLFLFFFVFFSLVSPVVAQFGSVLFIFGGCLIAPLFYSDSAEEKVLPLEPAAAIYAPAEPARYKSIQADTEERLLAPDRVAVCLSEIKWEFRAVGDITNFCGTSRIGSHHVYWGSNTPVRAGPCAA